MKHFGLAPVTVVTLLLTGVLLPASGWFSSTARPASHFSEVRAEARAADMSADGARRLRHGQPTHWRAMVLHR
jgi:hypothetical protein